MVDRSKLCVVLKTPAQRKQIRSLSSLRIVHLIFENYGSGIYYQNVCRDRTHSHCEYWLFYTLKTGIPSGLDSISSIQTATCIHRADLCRTRDGDLIDFPVLNLGTYPFEVLL